MATYPSYTLVVNTEIKALANDTFELDLELTNVDDSLGDPTGYSLITAKVFKKENSTFITTFTTDDTSLTAVAPSGGDAGKLLFRKTAAETDWAEGTYEMQVQFTWVNGLETKVKTYIHFTKFTVAKDINY